MTNRQIINGWAMFALISSSLILNTLAYPQDTSNKIAAQYRPPSVPHPVNDNNQNYKPFHQSTLEDDRKFAEKPNALKKVQLDDIDEDIQTNQIQDNGFSWTNMLGTLMTMFFNNAANGGPNKSDDLDTGVGGSGSLAQSPWANVISVVDSALKQNMLGTLMTMFLNNGAQQFIGPNKSDDFDTNNNDVYGGGGGGGGGGDNGAENVAPLSPWANVISVGLRIITTLLGGGATSDGIDKVDNGGGSPMQGIIAAVLSGVLGTKDPEQVNTMAKQAGEFINIVVNLLDALKTSFSHRSLSARAIGKKDSVSDAAVAGITMMKSYVRTYRNSDDKCMQRYLCEANSECNKDIGGSSIFCQLGTYATSFILERSADNNSSFESFYEAGRRGRSGENCRQIFLECNEV